MQYSAQQANESKYTNNARLTLVTKGSSKFQEKQDFLASAYPKERICWTKPSKYNHITFL